MRHDTRKEILEIARRLFNERGYNNVSTRDIANALDISKGNLTYYFKRKEEIIEAILAENPSTRMQKAPGSLLELNTFFEDIQKTVKQNAFYFWHHAQLAQISKSIEEKQNEAFAENRAMLEQALNTLHHDGLLNSQQYQGEYSHLVDTLLLASIYWVPFSKLKKDSGDLYTQQAWSIVFPYLTEQGKDSVASISDGL